jgi:hypothetical protein
MLPFLRRSDLTNYLGVSVIDVPKVWAPLEKLPKELPPPLKPIDDAVITHNHKTREMFLFIFLDIFLFQI